MSEFTTKFLRQEEAWDFWRSRLTATAALERWKTEEKNRESLQGRLHREIPVDEWNQGRISVSFSFFLFPKKERE